MSEPDSPRRGPPLSAGVAAGLLAGPPLLLLAVGLLLTDRPEMLIVPGLWVLAAVAGTAGLVRGRPGGIWWAAGALGAFALCVGAIMWGVWLGGAYRDLPGAAAPLIYPLTVGGFVWWPETRRWCGLLPPAGEDDG